MSSSIGHNVPYLLFTTTYDEIIIKDNQNLDEKIIVIATLNLWSPKKFTRNDK
jgi:hypothetical protein